MVPVCAGVLLKSGQVLLARRRAGLRHAGQWEFPGGRIEPGETAPAALARELKEEFGIEAEVGAELARTRHTYDSGEIELIAHLVSRFSGELKPVDHDKVVWVEARKVLEYDLVPADVAIAHVVAAHRRRDRYTGTHPKAFAQKYKELKGDPGEVEKAKARGSTPAGAHLSIMLPEVVEALEPLEGATVLDCTLGWGGHAEALARRAGPKGRVIGLDKDKEELDRTIQRISSPVIVGRHSDYADARAVLSGLRLDGVDALLADLGVSSMQLDRPERGMSFKSDGPLDMRMDRSRGKTAAEWLVGAEEAEIAGVLKGYGDEPDALKIARLLKQKPPKTTRELVRAIAEAKGLGPGRLVKKDAFSGHPAARTFQALRIVVNSERESLKRLLADLPALLRPGGRVAFLTFHLGEEMLVQEALSAQADAGLWQALAAPRKPSLEEIRANPRSRTARLWRAVRTGRKA